MRRVSSSPQPQKLGRLSSNAAELTKANLIKIFYKFIVRVCFGRFGCPHICLSCTDPYHVVLVSISLGFNSPLHIKYVRVLYR